MMYAAYLDNLVLFLNEIVQKISAMMLANDVSLGFLRA